MSLGALHTERLLLRRFTDADREPFAVLNADPEVALHLSGPMTRAESDALVDRIEEHWGRWGFGLYAVEPLAGGAMVGFVGLAHHRAMPDEVEVGWRLARGAWHRGLATEAAAAVVDAAFGTLGLSGLVSLTTDENVRSIRVMDKLGFRYACHLPFERWNLRVARLDAHPAPADLSG